MSIKNIDEIVNFIESNSHIIKEVYYHPEPGSFDCNSVYTVGFYAIRTDLEKTFFGDYSVGIMPNPKGTLYGWSSSFVKVPEKQNRVRIANVILEYNRNLHTNGKTKEAIQWEQAYKSICH